MIVSPDVPWPNDWPRRPHLRVYYYVMVVGALLSALLVFGMTRLLVARSSPAEVALLLLLGGLFVGWVAYGAVFFLFPYFRRRSTIGTVGPALAIRYRSGRVILVVIGVPYAMAGGLLLLGAGLRRDDPVVMISAGVCIALGAVVGVVVLGVRRRNYGLRLTPTEVQWHSVKRTVAVRWDVVYDVCAEHTPEYDGFGSTNPGLHIRLSLHAFRIAGSGKPPEDDILIPAGQLTAAPALALWVVEHYFRHPEHRHEMGTEAATERIRRGPE